jgi:hypothetical protein
MTELARENVLTCTMHLTRMMHADTKQRKFKLNATTGEPGVLCVSVQYSCALFLPVHGPHQGPQALAERGPTCLMHRNQCELLMSVPRAIHY